VFGCNVQTRRDILPAASVSRGGNPSPAVYFLIFGALPVPESVTICGVPVTSSLIVNSPLCGVLSVGLKVTSTSQLFPGANDVTHWLLTANGGEVVSPVIITLIPDFLELSFLIFTFLGLLVSLIAVDLPNFNSDVGEIFSLVTTSVGVALGVGVAVGVPPVALAVVVGVAVAVAVAVGVAEGVLAAVPVAVAVALAVGVAVPDEVAVSLGVAEAAVVWVAVDVAVALGVADVVAVGVGDPDESGWSKTSARLFPLSARYRNWLESSPSP
jgi:hypothetical protein